MLTRTYEILAKWIARETGVTVEFEPDACPRSDIKTKRIILPAGVDSEHAYAALAHLMHEAAHLRYTPQIPHDLARDQIEHGILNAIEDIRIDNYNMTMLPNIRGFYEAGTNYEVEKRETIDISQIPLHKKAIINAIYEAERLDHGKIREPEVEELVRKTGLTDMMTEGVRQIECEDWDGLRKTIQQIIKALGLENAPRTKPQGGCVPGHGDSGASGKQPDPEAGQDRAQGIPGNVTDLDLSDMRIGNEIFGREAGKDDGTGSGLLGEVAVQELTRNRFKDILNVKEIKRINEGTKLNADNLISYFTGDIQELFEDELIVKRKHSKIILVLDGSSSMNGRLLDGARAREVVGGTAKELVKILREVCDLEGLNVDYEIAAFTASYIELPRENWEYHYNRTGGGTEILKAFNTAMTKLTTDPSLDGNKMIIFMTDGEVSTQEIDEMKQEILRHGSDVKCMVIGVGADLHGQFVKDIVQDRNIIVKEAADIILLEAILTALDVF